MSFREKFDAARKNKVVRLFANPYILCIAAFVVIGIIDPNGFLTLTRNDYTIRKQKNEIVRYRKALEETQRRIDVLSSNKDSLETFAREEYYFQNDGEDVFVTVE